MQSLNEKSIFLFDETKPFDLKKVKIFEEITDYFYGQDLEMVLFMHYENKLKPFFFF